MKFFPTFQPTKTGTESGIGSANIGKTLKRGETSPYKAKYLFRIFRIQSKIFWLLLRI